MFPKNIARFEYLDEAFLSHSKLVLNFYYGTFGTDNPICFITSLELTKGGE